METQADGRKPTRDEMKYMIKGFNSLYDTEANNINEVVGILRDVYEDKTISKAEAMVHMKQNPLIELKGNITQTPEGENIKQNVKATRETNARLPIDVNLSYVLNNSLLINDANNFAPLWGQIKNIIYQLRLKYGDYRIQFNLVGYGRQFNEPEPAQNATVRMKTLRTLRLRELSNPLLIRQTYLDLMKAMPYPNSRYYYIVYGIDVLMIKINTVLTEDDI